MCNGNETGARAGGPEIRVFLFLFVYRAVRVPPAGGAYAVGSMLWLLLV